MKRADAFLRYLDVAAGRRSMVMSRARGATAEQRPMTREEALQLAYEELEELVS